MAVRIVTDSTADLPKERATALGISVVPLKVIFGSEEYLDGVNLDTEGFFKKLAESKDFPRTSQPTPADFLATYQRLIEEGAEAILSVHLSAKFSGTYQSACAARAALPAELQHIPIEVVDSESISLGIGMSVMHAAEEAQRGDDLAAIKARLVDRLRRTRILGVLDSLEHLRRGGRIGRASAFLGTMLSFKPIIGIQAGEVVPIERPRTRAKAYERVAQLFQEAGPVEEVVIVESSDELGEQLAAAMQTVHPQPIPRYKLGAVLGTHTGPGTVGIIFITAH
ncbi:MAG: DegV family protein [Thermogemmatispora sp.]|uniref:DegV family protein n=1 Tax=Thermogemmatispora sp. TaxID=1968838 RepID=UPI00260CF79E|nr:DegV family protein [Thermogemmatispora sp.]MBX5457807.1 DegV family protein [Thermogemmatispora sp.]